MPDSNLDNPTLRDALSGFLFADNAPGLAQALREQAACVQAASLATRKLIAAVEQWSGPVVFSSGLRHHYPSLLSAHQETWAAACKRTLPGRHDDQVLGMLREIWCKVFLDIILERMSAYSVTADFENIRFVRIFGGLSPELCNGDVIVTDKLWSATFHLGEPVCATELPAGFSPKMPLRLAVRLMDVHLQALPSIIDSEPVTISSMPRTLYSYGPIDGNDSEIKVEAIREFAAALDFVEKLMLIAARHFDARVKDKNCVWDHMLKNKVSPTRFGTALREYRHVETHAIEAALSRRRKVLAGPAGSTHAPRQTSAKQEKSAATAQTEMKRRPAPKTPRPRRDPTTP